MTSLINDFGKNAGKIWEALETHGPLTQNKLMKKTRLDEYDFYVAVGWLAKENKISKNGSRYVIGNTNLEPKVGKNAGKVWKTLESMGYVDEPYLPKLAGISNPNDVYTALGWLAREGKLEAKKVKPKKPQTKYGLKK